MKDFLKMALRNVLRNRRRSTLTMAVITLGLMFLFIIRGVLNGLQGEAIAGIVDGDLGNIQIVRKGYFEALPSKSLDYLFTVTPELKAVIDGQRGVRSWTERISFGGLVNHQDSQTTTPFIGTGIDPVKEPLTCRRYPDRVKSGDGEFIRPGVDRDAIIDDKAVDDIPDADAGVVVDLKKPLDLGARKNLATKQGEVHQALLGKTMVAGFLKRGSSRAAKVGDEVIVLASDSKGGQHSLSAKLTGLIDVPNPGAGKTVGVFDLSAVRGLLDAPEGATQIVLSLENRKDGERIQRELDAKLAPLGFEAKKWEDLAGFAAIIQLQDIVFNVIMMVILAILVMAISITAFMTVMERTREIGALMAIGYRRSHILQLFLYEGAFIGLAGGVLGLILGIAVISVIHQIGVPFKIPFTTTVTIIRPTFTLPFVIGSALAGVVVATLASLWPSWQASRMKPLEALSHN